MRLISARILLPVTIVLIAWGGVHLLAHPGSVVVQPATWPVASTAPSAAPAAAIPSAAVAGPSPSPAPGPPGGIPILPGALRQLNGDTRDTAIGLYALIQQLEAALRGHLDDLIHQLEPGR
ncbi:MAG TPA: hypothetical protein VIG86_02465 [Candidatus Dormibacteraeota bacterium]|jgi:hypothetical protein